MEYPGGLPFRPRPKAMCRLAACSLTILSRPLCPLLLLSRRGPTQFETSSTISPSFVNATLQIPILWHVASSLLQSVSGIIFPPPQVQRPATPPLFPTIPPMPNPTPVGRNFLQVWPVCRIVFFEKCSTTDPQSEDRSYVRTLYTAPRLEDRVHQSLDIRRRFSSLDIIGAF